MDPEVGEVGDILIIERHMCSLDSFYPLAKKKQASMRWKEVSEN